MNWIITVLGVFVCGTIIFIAGFGAIELVAAIF